MDPSRPDRILDEWTAVAHAALRPAIPPRRMAVRSNLSGASLAGASLMAVAVVVAIAWLGGRGPAASVGGQPSSSPLATASATTSAPPSSAAAPPSSAAATTSTCRSADLHARITMWDGAAGQRTATLELVYGGTGACTIPALARPQLVDGRATVLIDGPNPPSSATLSLIPGEVLTTLVQAGNYCGPTPAPPVSVAFVFDDAEPIIAAPASATDGTVPPCLGSGQRADISMHPWTPR